MKVGEAAIKQTMAKILSGRMPVSGNLALYKLSEGHRALNEIENMTGWLQSRTMDLVNTHFPG